ncbi:hypothetical protein ARMGADRAFT_1020670 [Armillaria gallica]|uniref:Uncharacterized protein n=1 Tax=Armillaria gallica TaxID=47427 RepID=A0A2H3CNT3_ARMGA|nr:hypothetical protein ARMGADRAFT_1020670 [Armillaria gallica]
MEGVHMFSTRRFLVGGCIADTLRFRSDSVLHLTHAGQSSMSHVGLDPQKSPLVVSMEENAELQHFLILVLVIGHPLIGLEENIVPIQPLQDDNTQCIHRLPFPRTNYPSND